MTKKHQEEKIEYIRERKKDPCRDAISSSKGAKSDMTYCRIVHVSLCSNTVELNTSEDRP